MKWQYEDIVDLPRPVSERHPPMPMLDRAAQFAPFAALTGYDEVIRETARYVDQPVELTDSVREELDHTIRTLAEGEDEPRLVITHYVPDGRKPGGCYVQTTGNLRRVDEYARALELVDGFRIDLDTVIALEKTDLNKNPGEV